MTHKHDAPQDGPTITQADREAAQDAAFKNGVVMKHWRAEVLRGEHDAHPLVQAFAAPRIAAEEATERATIEKVVAEMRDAIEAGYPAPERKVDRCAHGKFGWEDCIACYDDALSARLDTIERGEWK